MKTNAYRGVTYATVKEAQAARRAGFWLGVGRVNEVGAWARRCDNVLT